MPIMFYNFIWHYNKMTIDKKIVKLVVNYDSNENKDELKSSKNIQWYLYGF